MFKKPTALVVHERMIEMGATLAVAESLTAGNLQALVAARSGASAFFKGGLTAYTIPMKAQLLGINAAAAELCDAVSPDVAGEMAKGVCALYSADFGIATTGYAGPYPERDISIPYAHVAIARRGEEKMFFEGVFEGRGLNRKRMQVKTAEYAVNEFARALNNI